MKKKQFVKIIKDFIDEIYSRMKPYYLKQKIISNGKEFVVSDFNSTEEIYQIYDQVLDFDLLDCFTDKYKKPLDLFVFKTTLYKTILSSLLDGILRKDWYFVYACISILSNVSGLYKIPVDLERLEFIKTSLYFTSGDIYKKISYLIFNSLLEEKVFVIVEEYKDFEIYLEFERLKR